jgi:histidyl-tRNA synthetase
VARSPKKQLKLAADAGASYAVIIGEDELARGVVTVKELATGEQAEISRSELAWELTDRIRKEK